MTATKRKTTKRKSTKKKKGTRRFSFRRVPSYILWIAFGVIVAIYIAFFYKTFVGPYSFRWKALYGNVTYPKGLVRGLDISHYQGEIDWDKLRNADIQGSPVSFVFVKATQGTDIWDENFNQNFHNARKNDIVRGAYHYFSPFTSGKAQAKFFCKMVQLEEKDLPPVLDVEELGNQTPEQLQREVLSWMKIVEKHYGVKPILYTGYKFRTTYLNTPEFDQYPYWIAHYYVDSLEYQGEWAFWQHTDVGQVDGIKGNVDINVFQGDYQDLMDLTIKED
ncbi:MAG: glycoside hydrolase family 25 protein [Bacteroidaceae bacterium]|nr:glycoside hydrolase family 25 protein [Bacteroidaceae bacterium]MBR3619581.1 glycoside hydrolase family 25 protein [Bacteroidaceae bacterium]